MTDIAANLDAIRARIAQAQLARGPGAQVRLIAVSKRHSVQSIEAAYAAGQRDFGENYAQELEQKVQALQHSCPEIRWHMIGPLQRNKVPKVLGKAMIHSVDRASLVTALQSRAEAMGLVQGCLVQVNPGEAQKSGVCEAELEGLLQAIDKACALRCRGLMLIPPNLAPEQSASHFTWLAQLAARHRALLGSAAPELSMGMSQDYEQAIMAGATMVRVGSAIFGPRPAPVGDSA